MYVQVYTEYSYILNNKAFQNGTNNLKNCILLKSKTYVPLKNEKKRKAFEIGSPTTTNCLTFFLKKRERSQEETSN